MKYQRLAFGMIAFAVIAGSSLQGCLNPTVGSGVAKDQSGGPNGSSTTIATSTTTTIYFGTGPNLIQNPEFDLETAAYQAGHLPPYPSAGWSDIWQDWTANLINGAPPGFGVYALESDPGQTYEGRSTDNLDAAIFYSAANAITGTLSQTVAATSGAYTAQAWAVFGSGTHAFTITVSDAGGVLGTKTWNVDNSALLATTTNTAAWQLANWNAYQFVVTIPGDENVTVALSVDQGVVTNDQDGFFRLDSVSLRHN